MRALGVLRALGPIDAANVRRDALLRWMFLMPLLLGLLFRWGVPPIEGWLREGFQLDLAPYYPLIASFLVLTTPMMYGVVVGFLFLDQKDDQTMTALQVTPLTARGYLVYRIGIPLLLTVVMTPVVLELSGLARVDTGQQLAAGVAAAPLAPAFALFLAAFARNKVQGFALMKAAGALNWPPLVAWFVESNWQLAFGLCPTYWPAKLYWELEAGSSNAWIYLLIGVLYLACLIALLNRRFQRILHS